MAFCFPFDCIQNQNQQKSIKTKLHARNLVALVDYFQRVKFIYAPNSILNIKKPFK